MGCQLVCNARGLLLSAETHWPGGLKDNEVLERSALYKQLQEIEEGWLLGETWISVSLRNFVKSENVQKRSEVLFLISFSQVTVGTR